MSGVMSQSSLIGRDRYLSMLRDLLDRAVAGNGSAMVLRGQAGIGKSALLGSIRQLAADQGLTVVSAIGVENEAGLPFAALHQLLRPLESEVAKLPVSHQHTLRAAFGQEDGSPDLYAVALAALQLIGEAAAVRPTVVILDDLQWLDSGSADVLSFVARRIGSDAVLVLGATRTGSEDSARRAGLPDIMVEPLDEQAAAVLLKAQAPTLSGNMRQRLLSQAAGNPLALTELPRAMRQSTDRVVEDFPLTARLEAAFAARSAELSEPARTMLVVLAADVTCDAGRLLRAATELAGTPVGTAHLQEAIDVGLVEMAGSVLRFRHPLMRSATYVRAPLAQRLGAHTILAEVLAGFPDKQLWHRAAATLGADDAIAAQLEHYAQRSRTCGAIMAAVAALHRAAELSERPDRTTALLLHAAELASETGARREAQDLLARADLSTLGPTERARLAGVEEVVAFQHYDDHERRIRELVDIAADVHAAGNTDLAAEVLWRAASRCFFQDACDESRKAIAAQLDTLDLPAHDPRVLAIGAYSMPWERGSDVLDQIARLDPDRTDADAMRFLGYAALFLGDFRRGSAYIDNAAGIGRSQGRLGLLSGILGAGNWSRIWLGEWDKVRAETEESRAFAEETGEEFYLVAGRTNLAMIAALRGESELAADHLRAIGASPLATGMRCIQVAAQQTRGMLLLLDGRAEDAFAALTRVYDPTDPVSHPMRRWWIAPELADAAVACENTDSARQLLADLPDLAKRLPAPMLLVVDQYSRAVLADDADSDSAYTAALNGHVGAWPLYRARLQLHHGRRLRRLRRTSEAREPLRAARDTFDALGADPWAQAARNELRAAGETSTRRSPTARDQLTSQELQIATLAADGLTNRQIAEKLYLSHRTVGSHLYRIYPRLGITSRVELAGAISAIS
ncbi:helix-turn-helix transcriptional regulator [Nocardia rhizosphaerihabitans]|uniref:Transcriptional regulator n=1 Tax=Nocardia rhizosphaerihabitans TaxID=1691570 RepID=A0ABQ2KE40_9NOCA|nr:LuxR family transcriptional regulator [Nocardia rhizosphaerihabitans]GGN78536.1 transcriptional regulator [Nocardia rhizosphaerihabitans]